MALHRKCSSPRYHEVYDGQTCLFRVIIEPYRAGERMIDIQVPITVTPPHLKWSYDTWDLAARMIIVPVSTARHLTHCSAEKLQAWAAPHLVIYKLTH